MANKRLSPTQARALGKLQASPAWPLSAYDIGESLATLRALVAAGVARDVTPRGPGAMFSPRTHYKFRAK